MEKELLLKYLQGECDDSEKITIANWLDSDSEHMREYLSLRRLYDITIWQTTPVHTYETKREGKASVLPRKRIYSEILKIAAVFVLALIVFHFLPTKPGQEHPIAMQTLNVPAGQRAEITLEDGTKVWLNAKTKLTFPNQFSGQTREVQLDGEGFFEVKSDKSKPFIVKTSKYDVKVWGTRFNLIAYSEKRLFETSLLEGAVEVLNSGEQKGVMIRPDERVFQENDRLVIAPIDHMNHFLWTEGIISFENEAFPELVNKLELYFDLKIEVKNAKILNYKCTGKFRSKDGVEHILKVLQLRNKFTYKIDDKQNIITIE